MGAGCCCCPRGKEKGDEEPLGSPLEKRSCTDVICFALFFLYWGGLIGILIYTLLFGRLARLLNGYDSYGNTCGVDNAIGGSTEEFGSLNHTDRKYQFFMNYYDPIASMSICVKECPKRTLRNIDDVRDYHEDTGTGLCDYRYTNYKTGLEDNWACPLKLPDPTGVFSSDCLGPCPAFEVPIETPIINRCFPQAIIDDPLSYVVNVTGLQSFTNYLGKYRFVTELGASFYTVRYDILILMATALAIALLLVFLIRFLINVVVWFVVVVAAIASCVGTGLLWYAWYKIYKGIDTMTTYRLPIVAIELDAQKAYLTYSIVATVLTVILLLVIIVMRKRLQLAVALFQEAGKVLENSPMVLVQPIWTYILHIMVMVFGVLMLILISSVTDRTPNSQEQFRDGINRTLAVFMDRNHVTYFWWYIVIGVVWTMEFVIAVQELIIAGTVAQYYFTRDKKSLNCTICSATGRTILYHLGSAAFGAFLITLIRIPRFILMRIAAKLEKSENECAKFMTKCCICCLWCLEKCMRYINRNAYIVIAINGSPFCVARVKAFTTLTSNILRVAAINCVGDFVLFLGKVLVMAANVVIAYFLFDRHNKDLAYGEMNLFFLPTIAIAIYSYLIADCFLSSYEMLVDTLLLCFCEDVKINDGSEEKPYFMSRSLMKFVANTNKHIDTLKRKKKPVESVDTVDGGRVGTESERVVLAAADPGASAEDLRLLDK